MIIKSERENKKAFSILPIRNSVTTNGTKWICDSMLTTTNIISNNSLAEIGIISFYMCDGVYTFICLFGR